MSDALVPFYSDEWIEDKVMCEALLGSGCECCGAAAISDFTASLMAQCTDVDTEVVEGAKSSRWPKLLMEITWRDRLRIRQRLKRDMATYRGFWEEFGSAFVNIWTNVWPLGFKRKLLRVSKNEVHLWIKYALEEEAALAEEQRGASAGDTLESRHPDLAHMFTNSTLSMWTTVLEQVGYFSTPVEKLPAELVAGNTTNSTNSHEHTTSHPSGLANTKVNAPVTPSVTFPQPLARMSRPRVIDAPNEAEYPSPVAAIPERVFETSLVFIDTTDEAYYPLQKPVPLSATGEELPMPKTSKGTHVGYFTVHEGFLREPKAFLARAVSTSQAPLLPRAKRARSRSFAALLGSNQKTGKDIESEITSSLKSGYEAESESDDDDTTPSSQKACLSTASTEDRKDATQQPEEDEGEDLGSDDEQVSTASSATIPSAQPTHPSPEEQKTAMETRAKLLKGMIKAPLTLSAKPLYFSPLPESKAATDPDGVEEVNTASVSTTPSVLKTDTNEAASRYLASATGKGGSGQASQSFRADRRLLRTILFRIMFDKVIDAFLEAEEAKLGSDPNEAGVLE